MTARYSHTHTIHNFARLGLLVALSAACLSACIVLEPNGVNGQSEPAASSGAPCSMAITKTSFGGYCGNLSIANDGTYPMQGWQVTFDLPEGDSLISSWNGKFTAQGAHITVTSLEPNVPVASGATLQLGYCASAEAEDVAVTPGQCAVQNPNASDDAPATSLNSALNTNFSTLDGNIFQKALPTDGYATLCAGTHDDAISASNAGLSLGACGGVQWLAPVLYGITSAKFQAAPGPGVVTQLLSSVPLPSGIQGAAMAVSGSSPQSLALTVWQNGTASEQTVDLGFDATAAAHTYTLQWQDTGITWAVDGSVVGTSSVTPQASPEYINVSVWTADGVPSWAGTAAPSANTSGAQVTLLSFAPTVAYQ